MNTSMILLAAIALTLAGAPTLADDYSPGPGSGTPAAGGKGPGMGHDYRRNVGGPGPGRGVQPAQPVYGTSQTPIAPVQSAPTQPPASSTTVAPATMGAADAKATPRQPTVPGHRTYPNWAPGMAPPYAAPLSGYMRPRRPGYGYPGYRGRGWSPYPGHHQYGNPPRGPSGPPATE